MSLCRSPALIRIKARRAETAYQGILGNRIGPAAAMIVCSCNVFSDHQLREAFAGPDRPGTVSQIYRRLGHEAQCGRCTRTVRDIMRERETGNGEGMR